MNDQTPEAEVVTEPKSKLRDRLRRSDAAADDTSKPKRNLREKAKNVAAVIGVVTVVGAAAAFATKKKSAKVEVTLPDVEVSTDN